MRDPKTLTEYKVESFEGPSYPGQDSTIMVVFSHDRGPGILQGVTIKQLLCYLLPKTIKS